jgi:hypothetical protein
MYTSFPTNDRYTFTGSVEDKYEQGIVGTVAMLGFMSLKDSDHTVSGPNQAACKRVLKDAIATRKAADALLARGVVTLMGTWSNGIQVGPGPAFVAIAQPGAVKPARKARKPRRTHDARKGSLSRARQRVRCTWRGASQPRPAGTRAIDHAAT